MHAGTEKVLSVWHIDRCRHYKLFKDEVRRHSVWGKKGEEREGKGEREMERWGGMKPTAYWHVAFFDASRCLHLSSLLRKFGVLLLHEHDV